MKTVQDMRNRIGQLGKQVEDLLKEKKQMHQDLLAQRECMETAITHLESGSIKEAITIMQDCLSYRKRTQTPRKNRN